MVKKVVKENLIVDKVGNVFQKIVDLKEIGHPTRNVLDVKNQKERLLIMKCQNENEKIIIIKKKIKKVNKENIRTTKNNIIIKNMKIEKTVKNKENKNKENKKNVNKWDSLKVF